MYFDQQCANPNPDVDSRLPCPPARAVSDGSDIIMYTMPLRLPCLPLRLRVLVRRLGAVFRVARRWGGCFLGDGLFLDQFQQTLAEVAEAVDAVEFRLEELCIALESVAWLG